MASTRGFRKLFDEVVAIDVGTRFTKAVHVRRRGDALSLVNCALVQREANGKPLGVAELAEHLRSVVKQLKTTCRNLALTLRHEDAVILHADLPQAAPAELRKMIKLSPKAYVGQDLPDHLFDCFFGPPSKEGDTSLRRRRKSRVLVAGARRRVVEDCVEAARLGGMNLVALTPAPVALANAFRLMRDDSHPDAVALLDLGAKHSTINIVGHGEILLSRVVALGVEKFADVLSPEGGGEESLPDDASADAMQARLQHAILTFAREVDASVGFYTSQFERHISQLFVSGGTARSQLVLQMLESELSYSCEGWNLLRHITAELPEERVRELEYEMPQFVIALGCAVGLTQERAVQINLLAEAQEAAEARRRDPVRRLAFAGAAVVGLTLVWAGFLGWQWWSVRGMVADSAAKVQTMSASLDPAQRLASDRNAQAVPALHRYAVERVLFAPVMNALQFIVVDDIQVQQLTLTHAVEKSTGAPVGLNQERPVILTERVKLTLMLRNYGEDPSYQAWRSAVEEYPYFQERLRGNSPLILLARSQYQPDPLEPGRLYSVYAVDCYFEPRIL